MEIGEVIALIGASVPVASAIAYQVANSVGRKWMKLLADHKKDVDTRLAQGTEQFKRIDESLGLLLFLQATQSQHNEEMIRVAAPSEYKRHVEPRLKKFGRNGNGD